LRDPQVLQTISPS